MHGHFISFRTAGTRAGSLEAWTPSLHALPMQATLLHPFLCHVCTTHMPKCVPAGPSMALASVCCRAPSRRCLALSPPRPALSLPSASPLPCLQDPVTRLQQRLSIISAELKSVTEAEYRSGLVGEALPPSPRLAEPEMLQQLLNNAVVAPERHAPEREQQQQQAEPQRERQVAEPPAPATPQPPPEAREQQHAAPPRLTDVKGVRPEGTGREVLLQVGTLCTLPLPCRLTEQPLLQPVTY